MNTPTPETDAMVESTWQSVNVPTNPIPAEFARRLERERDEERQARDILTQDCERWRALSIQHARERDDWRCKLAAEQALADKLAALLESLHAEGWPQYREWKEARKAIEHAADEHDKTRERLSEVVAKYQEVLVELHMTGNERDREIRLADRLAGAISGLIEEYEDRKCQFGNEHLWQKHEDEDVLPEASNAFTAWKEARK